jgi:hypothetical protein
MFGQDHRTRRWTLRAEHSLQAPPQPSSKASPLTTHALTCTRQHEAQRPFLPAGIRAAPATGTQTGQNARLTCSTSDSGANLKSNEDLGQIENGRLRLDG